MRRTRTQHRDRRPRPGNKASRKHWMDLQRRDSLEEENDDLRRALREILGWYDTFDSPAGAEPDLTEADFERYRVLSRGALRIVQRAG